MLEVSQIGMVFSIRTETTSMYLLVGGLQPQYQPLIHRVYEISNYNLSIHIQVIADPKLDASSKRDDLSPYGP